MSELLDLLSDRLQPDTVRALSRDIGRDEKSTEQAVSMLLPMLVGGLARNTDSSREQRLELDRALSRDHDGGILDALGKLFGGDTAARPASESGGLLDALGDLLGSRPDSGRNRTTDADGILQHVLGDRRPEVEQGVGRASGIGADAAGKLIGMLAPMVMGALGRAKRERDLDADGVADLLQRERRTIEQRAPGMKEGGLMDMLDSNRDGKVSMADDIAKVGAALGAAWLFTRGRQRN